MAAPPAVSNALLIDLDPHVLGLVNGDPITTLTDQSGALRHFTQATAARKPTLATNALNGKSVAVFDGTDDTLANANTGITGQATMTLIVVMAQTAVPSALRRGIWSVSGIDNDFSQAANGGWNTCHTAAAETAWVAQTVGGGANATQDVNLKTSSTPLGTYAVSTLAVASNAAPTLYINGTAEGAGAGLAHPTLASTLMNLGSRRYNAADNDFAPIRVARALLYAGTLSAGSRATVHAFLQNEYAITMADGAATAPQGTATATASTTASAGGQPVATGTASSSGSTTAASAGRAVAVGQGAAAATASTATGGQPVLTGSSSATASASATGTGGVPSLVPQGSATANATTTASAGGQPVTTGSSTASSTASATGTGLAVATGTASSTVTVTANSSGRVIAVGQGAAAATASTATGGQPVLTGSSSALSRTTATGSGSAPGAVVTAPLQRLNITGPRGRRIDTAGP